MTEWDIKLQCQWTCLPVGDSIQTKTKMMDLVNHNECIIVEYITGIGNCKWSSWFIMELSHRSPIHFHFALNADMLRSHNEAITNVVCLHDDHQYITQQPCLIVSGSYSETRQ